MKNIEKYLNNTTRTMNGVVFKDVDAFENKKGICYIGEYALEALEVAFSDGVDFTDDVLIENCVGSTYQTILEEVNDKWEDFDDEIREEYTPEEVARNVFDDSDWTCISTTIQQMTC